MHGMFRSNGSCGYVKKPQFLMDIGPHNEVFDPKVKLPVKKTLQVSKMCFHMESLKNFKLLNMKVLLKKYNSFSKKISAG